MRVQHEHSFISQIVFFIFKLLSVIHNDRNTRRCLAIQQFPGYGNKNSTITLVMIRMHTIGFSYVVRPNNTTRLIKLLQQQSFKTSLNKMIFCQPTIFVSLQTLQWILFSQCLIDSIIETKNMHHVHYPRFGLYTFLTASQKEEHKNIKRRWRHTLL